MPVLLPMAATAVLLLLHVPPADGLVSVLVPPTHRVMVPAMLPGAAITVVDTVLVPVAVQPLASVTVSV